MKTAHAKCLAVKETAMDVKVMKEIQKNYLSSLKNQYPKLTKSQRNKIRDRVWVLITYNIFPLPPFRIMVKDVILNSFTTDTAFNFKSIKYIGGNKVEIYWENTIEDLENITIENFETFEEFIACFQGQLSEKDKEVIKDFYNKNK